MRFLALLGLLAVCPIVLGQPESSTPKTAPDKGSPQKGAPKASPSTMDLMKVMPAPQVSVVLKQHRMGPQDVTVTLLDPGFPAEVLAEACRRMGRQGQPIRGYQAVREQIGPNRDDVFLKASFAADGYIDREAGRLDVVSVVRAFAGIPAPHTISSLMITFDGETPTDRTLRSYVDKALTLAASASAAPPGIEYRVHLKTQDPSKIVLPDGRPAPAPAKGPSPMGPALPLPALLLIVVGAVALGVLVYVLAMKTGRRKA